MSITYYQSNKILDKSFGAVNWTPASTLYIGLSTTPLAADGSGYTEPVGNSYARVAVTNDKTNWTSAASGLLSNVNSISFPESSGSWGTITYVFIIDTASGAGNVMYFDVLSPSRSVATLTTVLFVAGTFQAQMTN